MKILVVEDDPFKFGEIERVIGETRSDAVVRSATSVKEAIAAVASDVFDCVLLDVALPSHRLDKGQGAPVSLPSGGTEVLMELSFLAREDRVIIVTQYPEMELEGKLYPLAKVSRVVSEMMKVHLLGVIRFDRLSDKWRPELSALLRSIR